jgi:hypothetical protein
MKQILFCLISLTFFSSALCMNDKNTSWSGSNSDDDELDIIEIRPERWREFSALDDQARDSASDDEADHGTPECYQRLLTDSLNNRGRYVVFAQEQRKLIGMAGAVLNDDSHDVATIHADYASARLQELLGHTQMIEALLNKIAHSSIRYAQVQIPSDKIAIISFYEQLGFEIVGTDGDETLLEKKLLL